MPHEREIQSMTAAVGCLHNLSSHEPVDATGHATSRMVPATFPWDRSHRPALRRAIVRHVTPRDPVRRTYKIAAAYGIEHVRYHAGGFAESEVIYIVDICKFVPHGVLAGPSAMSVPAVADRSTHTSAAQLPWFSWAATIAAGLMVLADA
jgi:hypothetical protein